MKKTFVWLLLAAVITALSCRASFANVYVICDSNKEVYTLSMQDDTVTPAGYTKSTIPGDIESLGLDLHPTYYKYNGNKFIKNQAKLDKEEADKELEKQKKLKLKADKVKAKDRLKTLNFTEDEIQGLLKGED